MSHMSVLVASHTPEEALEPFATRDSCDQKYIEFHDLTEEYTQQYSNDTLERVYIKEEDKHYSPYDSRFEEVVLDANGNSLGYSRPVVPRLKYPVIQVPIKDIYPSVEAYADDWDGCWDKETGKIGYWANPNGMWDWYAFGGRWTGFFKIRPGKKGTRFISLYEASELHKLHGLKQAQPHMNEYDTYVDQALKRDIDLLGTWERNRKRLCDDWSEAKYHYNDQPNIQQSCYGVLKQDTRDAFIQRNLQGSLCAAAILVNGEWVDFLEDLYKSEPMITWTKRYWEVYNSIPDDMLLTIVDCHY